MPDQHHQRTAATLRLLAASACAMALGVASSPAAAQEDRQAQSVGGRNAPEFTRRPLILGSFELFASIQVDTTYNDNIFALPDTEVEDVVFNIRPQILLKKARPDRETRLLLNAGIRRLLDVSNENSEQYSAALSTRQGIGSGTEWNLGVNAERRFEQRRNIDSFNETGDPVEFTNFRANAGVSQNLGALRVNVGGSARAVRFDGIFEQGGTVFDLSFRDFEVYSANARASITGAQNQEIYAQLTVDDRNFELAPLFEGGVIIDPNGIDRSSTGGRLEVGYRRQVTELLYLDVRAGYLVQNFADPQIDSIDGLAFQGDLLWNATPLTSVLFSAVRQVDENINPEFNGLVRSEARVQVEHELRRNIILTGRVGYANFDQTDSPLDGEQINVGVQAEYKISRPLSLQFDAEYFDRSGLIGFTQNTARLGVRYNF